MNFSKIVFRFFSKVEVNDKNECWNWKGAFWKKTGYGCFTIQRKSFRAHRFCYEIHFGKIPNNIFVLHKCDNPRCVNPSHLFLGTHTDNMRDKVKKNRQGMPRGSNHWNSKLSKQDIENIKKLKISGKKMTEICKIYNVHYNTIRSIFNNRRKCHF